MLPPTALLDAKKIEFKLERIFGSKIFAAMRGNFRHAGPMALVGLEFHSNWSKI
jgi:hypothetical protein